MAKKKNAAKAAPKKVRKRKATKAAAKRAKKTVRTASARKKTSKKKEKKSGRRAPQGKRLAGWELVTKEAVFDHLKSSKITVTSLSKTLGVTPGAVHSWKAGRRFPSAEAQKKLAEILKGTLSIKAKAKGRGGKPKRSRFSASAFRAAREARGLSRGALATQLGVSPSSLFNWESGKSTPRGQNLEKISTFMNEPSSAMASVGPTAESGRGSGPASPEAALGAAQVASAYLASGQPLTTDQVVAFVSELRKALS